MNCSDINDVLAEGREVLAGEVLGINDDTTDSPCLDASGRFPKISEDVLLSRLLASDYHLLGNAPKKESAL